MDQYEIALYSASFIWLLSSLVFLKILYAPWHKPFVRTIGASNPPLEDFYPSVLVEAVGCVLQSLLI
jgi:hypothetical protein